MPGRENYEVKLKLKWMSPNLCLTASVPIQSISIFAESLSVSKIVLPFGMKICGLWAL